jgi:hypothetical protein
MVSGVAQGWGAAGGTGAVPGDAAVPGNGAAPGDVAVRDDAAVSGDGADRGDAVVRDAYVSGMPRIFGMLVAIWQLTLLIQIISYQSAYRQAWAAYLVWFGLVAVAFWLVPRTRAGGLSQRDAAIAIAAAIFAVCMLGWEHRLHGAPQSVDWSVFGSSWLLALVAVSRSAWEWICGAVSVMIAHIAFDYEVVGVNALSLARTAGSVNALVVLLVIFAALQPTVRTHARLAARRVALASRTAAERAAAAAVREDRRERLALLEVGALPLLRGIADGTLDPADPRIREQCARHAATMRRALVDQSPTGAGLLAELGSALTSAREHGVPVEVQVVGNPGAPAPEVAGAARDAVDSLVSALPPQPVLLTVLASDADVELYVAFEQPPRATPDLARLAARVPATAHWSASVDVSEAGSGCLEVHWSNAAAGTGTGPAGPRSVRREPAGVPVSSVPTPT